MKSERRKGYSYMQVVTKNIVVIKMSRNNVHFIFITTVARVNAP